jgi:aspartate/methionine/tyrosine aminotransferase
MRIPEFRMERMQSTWEHVVRYDLSESGVRPLSAAELFADDHDALERALRTPLGYAQGNGAESLREAIASFYPGARAQNVCVTTGTSEANFLALTALVEPGDRVVVVVPSYMQVHGWARALGANVVPVWLEEARGWQFVPDLLRQAARGAKVIYVCDPNNPTGAVLDDESRATVREAAQESGAWLLADQVYRGAERAGALTPSFFEPAARVVVTAGLSKVFGLPGLRVGWVVTAPEMATRIWSAHDYSTIAPTTLSAIFAERALRQRDRLIARAREILTTQWPVLEEWLRSRDFAVVPPAAGAIAFARGDLGLPAEHFVNRLIREQSAMVVPGEHFLMEGYLRIGFGSAREQLEAGLARIAELLARIRVHA